jgi:hypothetical protein
MLGGYHSRGIKPLKFKIAQNRYSLSKKLFSLKSTGIAISLIILTLITPFVEGGSSWYQTDWSDPSSYKSTDNLDTNSTPGDITLGGYWGWNPKMDLPQARDHLGTAVLGGKIYAIGGWNNNIPGFGVKLVTEYDPVTNIWTPKAQLTDGRQSHGVVAINNSIYAIGGYYGTVKDTVEVYNASTNTWATKTPMITKRLMFGIAAVDKEIYIIGGRTETSGTKTSIVEAYNISADNWTAKTSMPTVRESFGAVSVNGLIYAIGGEITTNTFIKTVEVYNPANDTWWKETDMNKARCDFGITVYDKEIYVIGGYNNGHLNSVEKYNVTTKTWTYNESLPFGRTAHACTTLNDNIYSIGGNIGSGLYLSNVDALGFKKNGTLISNPQNALGESVFKTMNWDSTTNNNTKVMFQFKSATSEPDLSLKDFTGPNGSINSYYNYSGQKIWEGHNNDTWYQYKVFLNTTNINFKPVLHKVTINYNRVPSALDISSLSPTVYRRNKIKIVANGSDFEDTENKLNCSFQFRPPSGTWTDINGEYYNIDRWETYFEPYLNAELGEYDFRVNFSDTDNDSSKWILDLDNVTVLNFIPSIDNVSFSSFNVSRTTNISVYINATDEYEDKLKCSLQYKSPNGTWTDFNTISYFSDYWLGNFTPSINAELGLYDLRINFSDNDGGFSNWYVLLDSFEVINHKPKMIEINYTHKVVYRNESIIIITLGLDKESLLKDLICYVEYKPPDSSWVSLANTNFVNDHWETIFKPNITAKLGYYDFRAKLLDSDGGYSDWKYSNKSVLVKNNIPTDPIVEIIPQIPTSSNDLKCSVIDLSIDIENEIIWYLYDWYKNGELQDTLSINSTSLMSIIGEENTTKGENWKCVVTPFDGIDYGAGNYYEVLIHNSPPVVRETIKEITIREDSCDSTSINLLSLFYDHDNDELNFFCKGNENINVTIYENNGSVILIPKPNWNGEEKITFYANDSLSEIHNSVNVTIIGVNDFPMKPIITEPLNNSIFIINSKINFSAFCYDPDEPYGDILEYTWESDISGKIGEGSNINDITLREGIHKISLIVSDGKLSSDAYIIVKIKKVIELPLIELINPLNNTIINLDQAILKWETKSHEKSVLTYNVLLGRSPTSMKLISEHQLQTDYTVNNLTDRNTYYWTVIPIHVNINGKCIDGIWSFKVNFDFVSFYDISLSCDINKSILEQNDNATYNINVKNNGNIVDRVLLNLESGIFDKNATLNINNPILDPNEDRIIKLSLYVSENVMPATYPISLSGQSIGESSDSITISIIVKEKGSGMRDKDGDGMLDRWEDLHGLNSDNPLDANFDSDDDKLSNLDEFYYQTDPNLKDTDNDGYDDYEEIKAGTDPLDPKSKPTKETTSIWIWVGIIIISVVIIISLIFIFLKKKKEKEEPPVEETETPSSEVPSRQFLPLETPPEQTQVLEVTPQQSPIPEVSPQVPQLQVEPQPQEQAPVPKVKTQPTIKDENV